MALTAAEIETRIEEIDTLLASGVDETEFSDGRRVSRNLTELRLERDRLQAKLAATSNPRRIILSPTSGVEC